MLPLATILTSNSPRTRWPAGRLVPTTSSQEFSEPGAVLSGPGGHDLLFILFEILGDLAEEELEGEEDAGYSEQINNELITLLYGNLLMSYS